VERGTPIPRDPPELPVILMSGHSVLVNDCSSRETGHLRVVAKACFAVHSGQNDAPRLEAEILTGISWRQIFQQLLKAP